MKMANVFAAYIDSSDTWGFQKESYDSQIGFYTNAWVNDSRESTEETTTHPCSYFYQVGKEDEVGFTPTRITINNTNGILTVEGRQKNVASILSKSFRVSSPSPRFFNLRESRRNRRPARILVSNIITDDNEELINIKNHLNIDIEVEEVAISRAEEFGADGGAAQLSCTHKNKDGSECYDSTDLRSNGWYIGSLGRNEKVLCPKHGKEEHPGYYVGGLDGAAQLSCTHKNKDGSICWREGALSSDGWLIWESGQGEETLCPQHGEEQYPSYYGAEEFGAEGYSPQVRNITNVDDKVYVTVYFPDANYGYERIFEGNMEEVMLNDYETPSGKLRTFGADEITCEKCVNIDPVYQSALDDLAESWDNIGYSRDEIRCPMCGEGVIVNTYDAETFGAERGCDICGNIPIYETGMDTDMFGDDDKLYDVCQGCYKTINRISSFRAESFEAKGDGHKCPECGSESSMQRSCSHCNNEWEIDIGQFGAESFEAKDENKMLEILQLLQVVESKATGSNAAYAKTYAKQALMSYYQFGMNGLKTQVAYTLSNLSGWRGEEAKSVKAQLKKLIK